MYTYIFCPSFGSLDFGKPKFWLAIVLVGQKLVANQSGLLNAKFAESDLFVWLPSFAMPIISHAIVSLVECLFHYHNCGLLLATLCQMS